MPKTKAVSEGTMRFSADGYNGYALSASAMKSNSPIMKIYGGIFSFFSFYFVCYVIFY